MNHARKVIIVEDSPTVKFEVRLLLQNLNIKLYEAGGELGLFNQIEEYGELADLIIMDLTLKNENGFDLIEKMKGFNEYNHIPVLVLTEHANTENVLKAKNLGVSGYIRKPIKREDFIDKVKEILSL